MTRPEPFDLQLRGTIRELWVYGVHKADIERSPRGTWVARTLDGRRLASGRDIAKVALKAARMTA